MSNQYLLKELSRYNIGTWADILYRNALIHPNKEAIIYGDIRLTYSEFNKRVNKLIHALHQIGVKKGDVLGILSWNCSNYTEVYAAAMKGGFIASPFNPRLTDEELLYIINYSKINTLFIGSELVDIVNRLKPQLPEVKNYICFDVSSNGMTSYDEFIASAKEDEPDVLVNEDDPVCIIYTSGTTGVPRGALYTQARFMEDSRMRVLHMGLQPGDKHVQISPLFHIGGNTSFRALLYIGGCNVLLKNFDPENALRTIQNERATHMEIVPTHLIAMMNLPNAKKYDIRSMKMMWYAASPMPLEVLKKGIEMFGPIFAQGYGQTESGPNVLYLSKEDHNCVFNKNEETQKKLQSAGRPNIGVQVRIVDDNGGDVIHGEVGEIIVRGKHLMAEYWLKPDDTQATIINGWLHTGDLGYYDEEGYIYLVDRIKDLIISGGENVYPREVEEVIFKHPAVLEAAVIGIPDPYWVERVCAVVVIRSGISANEEEINNFCKKHIASFKVPKTVIFVDSLPKSSVGKVLKRELRAKYKDIAQKI